MTSYHRAHLTEDPRRATVWKAIADHLAAHVPPDAHVLEIGAGYCDWINNVRAARRVAIDLWPEMPRYAGPGVEPLVLDVSNGLESLGDASFDVVLASNLLEHFGRTPQRRSSAAWRGCSGRAAASSLIQPNFRLRLAPATSMTTRTARFSPTCRFRRCCARGFTIERSSRGSCPTRCATRASRLRPGSCGLSALADQADGRSDAGRRAEG